MVTFDDNTTTSGGSLSERRLTSVLGWFGRTARHMGVVLLALGCDGPPGLQEGTDHPRTAGRADAELERVEFFGTIVDSGPGPDPSTGRADAQTERQGHGATEDLELLPAPLLLKAGKDPVHSVAFSPDRGIVAAGDGMNEGFAFRGKLYLWETRSGKLISKHEGFRGPVERICFSDSGEVVAASPAFQGPVIVWDVGQEGRKAILPANSYVLGLTSETEALVAMERWVSEKKDARQWDIVRWRFDQPPKPENVVIQDAGAVTGLSGNKQVLFGYYRDGRVVFWSTRDWTKLAAIDVGEGDPHAISDDGRLLAAHVDVWTERGPTTLDVWDLREQKLLRRYRPSTSNALRNMVFHSSGEVLAENYYTDLFLRDLETGQFFATWSPPRLREGPNEFITDFTMTSVAVSRDGEALAVGLFHTNEVALFRISQSNLKRLRDAAKPSSTRETPDTEKRKLRDGAED
jgi:WD40 repeat protein